jgi:hypothetical protein
MEHGLRTRIGEGAALTGIPGKQGAGWEELRKRQSHGIRIPEGPRAPKVYADGAVHEPHDPVLARAGWGVWDERNGPDGGACGGRQDALRAETASIMIAAHRVTAGGTIYTDCETAARQAASHPRTDRERPNNDLWITIRGAMPEGATVEWVRTGSISEEARGVDRAHCAAQTAVRGWGGENALAARRSLPRTWR